MDFPVFDLHCDTANELIGLGDAACTELRKNSVHIDLERAGELSGYAQCFACFTTTDSPNISPVDIFERKLAAIHREINKNQDIISLVYSPEEIEQNKDDGLMSAILTIEGPAGFGFDPELLQDLHQVGFRISTLGWNESNPLTGSCKTGEGLTDLGREYVIEAQRLGMIIDVSHISDKGFYDIIDITNAPIIATHSNSRSVCNVARNLTDDMFRQICGTGGVVGVNLFADFLGKTPSVDTVCDHIFHFLDIDPSGKHIALGADFDGCDTLPSGISGVQDYPKLAQRLLERGLSETTVYDIFWSNALEVFKKCYM